MNDADARVNYLIAEQGQTAGRGLRRPAGLMAICRHVESRYRVREGCNLPLDFTSARPMSAELGRQLADNSRPVACAARLGSPGRKCPGNGAHLADAQVKREGHQRTGGRLIGNPPGRLLAVRRPVEQIGLTHSAPSAPRQGDMADIYMCRMGETVSLGNRHRTVAWVRL